MRALHVLVYFLCSIILLSSCGISKKAHMERVYLQGADTSLNKEVLFPEPLIQRGDLLTIMVYSDNEEAANIYNQQQTGGNAGGAGAGNVGNMSAAGRGYQVDGNGHIYFHSIGQLKVEGMTRQQIADTIIGKLRLQDVLQNPYATVRFTQKRVTVLGEVNSPGVLNLPDQKVSILDVIGLSGDLTNFGRRDNILVIREEDGERKSQRLDIRSSDVYNSPYFYLKQNDLVYVEPNRRKTAGNDQLFVRNVGIVTSILSVVTVTIALLTR